MADSSATVRRPVCSLTEEQVALIARNKAAALSLKVSRSAYDFRGDVAVQATKKGKSATTGGHPLDFDCVLGLQIHPVPHFWVVEDAPHPPIDFAKGLRATVFERHNFHVSPNVKLTVIFRSGDEGYRFWKVSDT